MLNSLLDLIGRIGANLAQLGARKLALLGLSALIVAGLTALAAYLLTRPSLETLYSGIDRQDAARISSALRDAGVSFDTSADGTTVYVKFGQAPQARMILAEKGLPFGSSGGYELFDKLGSLGLTTFMQEITRVRALEGELARTIQLIRGVKAARVHLVLGDEGSFRKARTLASASIVLRTDQTNDPAAAAAARRLVTAAVAGMTLDQVTVLGSDGTVLAANDDGADGGSSRLRQLERSLAAEIQDNIRKVLAPHLNLKNFQVSVAAALNGDRRQTDETIYNPESKVERSVRIVKESQSAQNSNQAQAMSVERNLPQDKGKAPDSKQTNEENQKREELTNFELSSKHVTTTSGGYAVERLSVALLVNKASLAGKDDKAAAAELGELEQIAVSAAGLRKDRGDTIKISAVDFVDLEKEIPAAAAPGLMEIGAQHIGTLISALAAVVVAALLLVLGLRPLARALSQPMALAPAAPPAISVQSEPQASALPSFEPAPPPQLAASTDVEFEQAPRPPRRTVQKKLEKIIDIDEQLAATILSQWIKQESA